MPRAVMHTRITQYLALLACALGLVACKPQATPAQTKAAAQAAKAEAALHSNLPFANYTDAQLQARWNNVANMLDLDQFALQNCQDQPVTGKKTRVMCRSTGRGSVYFERVNGKVTRVQFVAFLGIFSERLKESSKVMVRFLHHDTEGDDITLYNTFNDKASRQKKFCVLSPAVQSKLCYLVSDKSYAVEARGF